VSDERTHFSDNYFDLVSSTVNQLTTETSFESDCAINQSTQLHISNLLAPGVQVRELFDGAAN
jgi:hypothetical protein